jgi:hypothetical protein
MMNASAPLKIISLGNCWEHVHPDVIRVPTQFAAYPYFMVFTPYPLTDDRLENPTIRASDNGLDWQRLAETPDPLVLPPDNPDMHHADPELVYDSGRLHLIYLTIRRSTDEVTFNTMNCKGDFHWSKPQVIHEDVGAVSPTYQVSEGIWEEWFIRMNASKNLVHSELVHREGYNLTNLRNERACDIEIPQHVPWHIDVLKVEEAYEALVAAFPKKYDPTRTRLFHLSSKDGLMFKPASKNPIIEPSLFGWDDRAIYRSSFLKEQDGSYWIWYSALSWGCHCGIGLLDGSIDSLHEKTVAFHTHAPVPRYVTRLPGELNGRLRYELRHHLPSRFLSFVPTAFFMHRQR